MKLNALALLFASFLAASAAGASTEKFTVIFGGKNVGHLKTSTDGDTTKVDFDFKNNGRGPTMAETVRLDGAGFPTHWTVRELPSRREQSHLDRFDRQGQRDDQTAFDLRRAEREPVVTRPLCTCIAEGA
jgi:hypothetical protein